MNGTTYYVETCFHYDDSVGLLVDHCSARCFGKLEAAQDFAREWVTDDDTHKAVIWKEVETIEHEGVSDE